MSLILKNASFKDTEGLKTLIKLYQQKKITKAALGSELTIAAQESVVFGNNFYIEIIDGKAGDKSFGMVLLPKTSQSQFDLFLYIDSYAFSILKPEQIINGILLFIGNYVKVTKEFAKFNMQKLQFDLDLVDTLIEALKLYKISLEIFSELETTETELNSFIKSDDIEKIIEKLENEPYTSEEAKELVKVHNVLPDILINSAEEMVKGSKQLTKEVEKKDTVDIIFGEIYEKPESDFYYKELLKRSDRTYPMYKVKEIDPNYTPDTNQ